MISPDSLRVDGYSPYDSSAPNILPKAQWHELVEQEVETCLQNDQSLSVIFIDIDNLKNINDIFGHAEGDDIIDNLQVTIGLIQDSFRTHNDFENKDRPLDLATIDTPWEAEAIDTEINGHHIRINPGRIGGDEFAVLCHTDSRGVKIVVDRIRNIFRETIRDELRDIGVDISIGASTLKPGMTASELLKLADEQLYIDKESHLPELSHEDSIVLKKIIEVLEEMKIHPRHLGKYAAIYARDVAADHLLTDS